MRRFAFALTVLTMCASTSAAEPPSPLQPTNDPQYVGSCLRLTEIKAIEDLALQMHREKGIQLPRGFFASGAIGFGDSRYQTPEYRFTADGEGMTYTGQVIFGRGRDLVYVFKGKVTTRFTQLPITYVFEGDVENPLTFVYTDEGLVYLQGKGSIINAEGKTTALPCVTKKPTGAKVLSPAKKPTPATTVNGR